VTSRTELNRKIGALAFGRLRLNEEDYREIVASIDPKSDGHVTQCDDDHANLVLIALRRLAVTHPPKQTDTRQNKFIARLMQHLNWNWKNTADFCKHQTGKDSTRSCSSAELTKIVNGMIAIIDHDIAGGKLVLSPAALAEYRRHTQHHRTTQQKKETA
jgi:hypothetical protein